MQTSAACPHIRCYQRSLSEEHTAALLSPLLSHSDLIACPEPKIWFEQGKPALARKGPVVCEFTTSLTVLIGDVAGDR